MAATEDGAEADDDASIRASGQLVYAEEEGSEGAAKVGALLAGPVAASSVQGVEVESTERPRGTGSGGSSSGLQLSIQTQIGHIIDRLMGLVPQFGALVSGVFRL
jgi:hypothetical protein